VATLPGGHRVTGVLHVRVTEPASPEALWSSLEAWELTPLIGGHGIEGMDAVLRACRARLDRARVGADSSCVVTWPSRDAEATRALLDHGMVPLTALAVRTERTATAPASPEVTVRPAGVGDVDTVLQLEQAELDYSSHFGGMRAHRDARERTRHRAALRDRLAASGEATWLAELDGVVVGLLDTGSADVSGEWPATVLPPGRWGCLHSVAVLPQARGVGVGRALAAAGHARLARAGVRGTYLFYNPVNPLSSVFWHRQGYRPLWTIWEVRPATGLR
jgi:GNAT superfamily N-acetyltransferase